MGLFQPNFTQLFLRRSSFKIMQMVPVCCIIRSQKLKIDFKSEIFKNLLDQNRKAQRSDIWYVALSNGPLPRLFKECPWGQKWPRPGVT